MSFSHAQGAIRCAGTLLPQRLKPGGVNWAQSDCEVLEPFMNFALYVGLLYLKVSGRIVRGAMDGL